jgi:hypothetical protein
MEVITAMRFDLELPVDAVVDFSPYVQLHREFFKTCREMIKAAQPISEVPFLLDCNCEDCRRLCKELQAAGLYKKG